MVSLLGILLEDPDKQLLVLLILAINSIPGNSSILARYIYMSFSTGTTIGGPVESPTLDCLDLTNPTEVGAANVDYFTCAAD